MIWFYFMLANSEQIIKSGRTIYFYRTAYLLIVSVKRFKMLTFCHSDSANESIVLISYMIVTKEVFIPLVKMPL